jgi:cell division protein FtsQ
MSKIVDVFTADFGRSLYLMPLDERRQALLRIDWVRDATVSRLWPDRIWVRITERTPIAFVQLQGAAGQGPGPVALIDSEGVILDQPVRANLRLPALTGINAGQSREARAERVAAALRLIAELDDLSEDLAEIDAGDPHDLKVIVPINGRVVSLQLGNRNFLSRLQNFRKHFEEIEKRLPNAAAFDLRLDDRITALAEDGKSE